MSLCFVILFRFFIAAIAKARKLAKAKKTAAEARSAAMMTDHGGHLRSSSTTSDGGLSSSREKVSACSTKMHYSHTNDDEFFLFIEVYRTCAYIVQRL